MRILLISGDSQLQTRLKDLLAELKGFSVELAARESVDEGISAFAEGGWDAVLVGETLDQGSGVELIERASTVNASVPFILLTESHSRRADLEAMAAGASDCLPVEDMNPVLLRHAIRYASNRKGVEAKLRESNDELVRHMLNLRIAKEEAETQAESYRELAENLETAKDELEGAAEAVEESERRYRILAENSPVGIWQISVDGYTLYMNAAMRNIFEVPEDLEALRGVTCDQLVSEENAEAMRQAHETWIQGDLAEIEVRARGRGSGELRYLVVSGAPILSAGGIAQSILVTVTDITARKKVEERAEYLAQHDTVTELPNRALFKDRLQQSVAIARRRDVPMAVLFVDLDNFKDVNDTLGHQAGDDMLRQVAHRLMQCVRETDTAARLGGDEFAIIASELRAIDDVTILARRMLQAMSTPFTIHGQEVHSGASIGVTIFPDDSDNADQLLTYADLALYHAKGAGKGTYQFYNQQMGDAIHKRKALEGDMRKAVANKGFQLFYQPQIDLKTGKVIGCEALIRWPHAERGMVSPGDFIPLAESTGLIVPIGEWVMVEACEQARRWLDEGIEGVRMGVNLSALQFRRVDLVTLTQSILRDTGLDPSQLELELTESMVMDDTDSAVDIMRGLNGLGVALAIDDFGTGFSSLSYLKKFPVERLKIDQSFVRDVTDDPDDAAIATTIINLAHSLNMNVIAEGAETTAQASFLQQEHCDDAQGYLFGKPMPEDEFRKWWREHEKARKK